MEKAAESPSVWERVFGFFEDYPIVLGLIIIVFIIFGTWILIRINHAVFRRIRRKREGLNTHFFERVISALILIGGIILIISIFSGESSVWRTVLGGTALVSAVLAFAAQDVIKDILGGLMISLYKPFEIGNRVELEDGTVGIVKDITMRHVILDGMDTQKIVIPNSKINLMRLKNFSFHSRYRGAQFAFYIAYGSDIDKAIRVIREAVISSQYSVPGKQTASGEDYADVYFMAYEESSLRLMTTVYFEAKTPSEVAISDINRKVNTALRENGIEIPYQYLNVIQKTEELRASVRK